MSPHSLTPLPHHTDSADISWNFSKFLIDANGEVVGR